MIVNNKICIVYDVESLKNVFSVTCKNTKTGEISIFEVSERKNQMFELVEYFSNLDSYFVGYNNHHYDDIIINYCIRYYTNQSWEKLTKSIYNLSQLIINSSDDNDNSKRYQYLKYDKPFYSIDLLTLLFSSKLRCSLKEMQVTMHYKNVEEFLVDWTKELPIEDIPKLLSYNVNDVESTKALLYRCKTDIELRQEIEKEYGIHCLSMDGVTIGTKILAKIYMEKTGIPWWKLKSLRSPADKIDLEKVILPIVKFKHPILKELLDDMLSKHSVSPERKGYENTFVFGGIKITVGVGGIHGDNGTGVIVPSETEVLLDSDVASLYPSLIIEHEFYPPHLGKEFLEVYSQIREERLEAKAKKIKVKNETLKLALNGLSGKLQEKHSWAYSPFTVMQVRINGQLLLLMLAERLVEVGCKLQQINTDGILYIAPKDKLDIIDKIKRDWEIETKLILEDESFESFYQLNVNGYFAKYTNGYIKKKGFFLTETELGKGMTPKIIPEAVINYFINDIDPEDYIKSEKDIRKFLKSEKTGKQWSVEYGEKEIQRINRFYASTNGMYLYKKKKLNASNSIEQNMPLLWDKEDYDSLISTEVNESEEAYQYNNMLSSSGVTVINILDDISTENKNINYSYYITEAKKTIEQLKPRLTLF